jgi:hypothetical protein
MASVKKNFGHHTSAENSEIIDFEYRRELAQQLVKRFGFQAARETCIAHHWEGVLQAVNRFSTH